METLYSDTLFSLLLRLKGADLFNLCAVNRQLAHFCDNDRFWETKVARDYQNVPRKPPQLTWKQFYQQLGTTQNYIKPITVNYNEQKIGVIWINYTDIPDKILSASNKLFSSLYPDDSPNKLYSNANMLEWLNPISGPTLVETPGQDYYKYLSSLTYTEYAGMQGKQGVIRSSLMGKRVNYAARTVVGPNR